ncbi:MAG: hypothetical protein OEW22_03160 [Rubrivivax sp.]|nr:hypothetical protein [Rubrivivax sp.]
MPAAASDRPPILRFLLLFAVLLTVALGLAVLSPSAGADDATERAAGDSVSVAPAGDPPPR